MFAWRRTGGDGLDLLTAPVCKWGGSYHSQPVIMLKLLITWEEWLPCWWQLICIYIIWPRKREPGKLCFMPKELMGNLRTIFYRDSSTFSHIIWLGRRLFYVLIGANKIPLCSMRRGGKKLLLLWYLPVKHFSFLKFRMRNGKSGAILPSWGQTFGSKANGPKLRLAVPKKPYLLLVAVRTGRA